MIKKIAWDTFKKTGDINTFLELSRFKNIEEEYLKESLLDGTSKSKGNSNIRK